MYLKTFTAPTMREALDQVRREMGEDAIILATDSTHKGRIEVSAGLERPITESSPFVPEPPTVVKLAKPQAAPLSQKPIELYQDIERALKRHRFPERLLYKLVDLASTYETTDPKMALAAALHEALRFSSIELNKLQKPLVLVGPPGAGKTVTTAKLAARALLQNMPLNLITVDTVHLGGIEQLGSFAKALDIRPYVASSPQELVGLLKKLPSQLTIIDTWGVNPFDTDELDSLYGYILAAQGEPVLVLPAGYDKSECVDIATNFKQLGILRMIFTRLDVARRLCCPVTTAIQSGLMLAEAGVAPQIADGLIPMDPLFLAEHLLTYGKDQKELAA